MDTVAVPAIVRAHCGIAAFVSVFVVDVVGVVNGHMPFQQVLSAETFCANRANKRSLPGVAPDVTYKIISTSVFRLATTADI